MAINCVTNINPSCGVQATGGSGNSKNYLSALKEKYPDVSVNAASINSAEHMSRYANGHIGSFNHVTIAGNILEKMANDPKTAQKYESMIAKVPQDMEKAKEMMAARGTTMLACGMNIDKNGKVNYWCVGSTTEKMGDPSKPGATQSMMARMAELSEEKRARQKEEAAESAKNQQAAKTGRGQFIGGESNEDLLKKIAAYKGNANGPKNKYDTVAFGGGMRDSNNTKFSRGLYNL